MPKRTRTELIFRKECTFIRHNGTRENDVFLNQLCTDFDVRQHINVKYKKQEVVVFNLLTVWTLLPLMKFLVI